MLALTLASLIRFYQLTVGALKPPSCRYLPTCSEYARLAVLAHGPARGAWLGAKRLAKCHPWGGFGHDPVPERPGKRESCPQVPGSRTPPGARDDTEATTP